LALTDFEKERIIYNELRSKKVKEVGYLTNFESWAIEEGMEKGEQIGMLCDARELVMDALEEKFGEVPEELQGRLQEIQSREVLRGLLRQAIRASSLEDFMKSLKIRGIKS
jgi:hypothetical protein